MKKWKVVLPIVALGVLLGGNLFLNHHQEASEDNGWNLILVNEDYYIPEDYTVELVTLDNGERVAKRIFLPLQEMFEAAEKDGVYMVVADGYRSKDEQQEMLDEKADVYQKKVFVKQVAMWMAKKWVANPGTSEHQLGIAVDIHGDSVQSSNADVYVWLSKHAHEYGFVERYPTDKVEVTGIRYEPWHYRYVGEEAASQMFKNGLCLEEYLEEIQ